MTRALAVAFVLTAVAALAASCGADGGGEATTGEGGLTLQVGYGPLRAGAPVAWELVVANRGDQGVTLVFASGQDGDVVLARDGQERYRWSLDRSFTQALREVPLPAGATRTFTLEPGPLAVEPGEYELEATLAARPHPPAARETVTVDG